MKPDWKDAPEWANWLAMGSDGYWYWFENKPVSTGNLWVPSGTWKDTLEARPNEA